MLKHKSILGFVVLCIIWSSTWLFIKLGLQTMPPFFSVGIRFFIAFLVLYIYALKLKLKFPTDIRSHIFFVYFGFILFTAAYGLVYWGEQYINSGLTSVLFSVMPFYTVVLSLKMLPEEKVTSKKMTGLILGFIGILIIFGDQIDTGLDQQFALFAMIAVLLSPLFSALGSIMGKKISHKYQPVTLNTLPLLYASISFLGISYFTESNEPLQFTGMAWFSLFYLGIFGTAIAFVVYFWMLKHTSILLMSVITFITPPLALVWGWIVLGEQITWRLFAGMIIVFTGLWFVRDFKPKTVQNSH
jgi:drug/metabolite transporter (DMT)-like permease